MLYLPGMEDLRLIEIQKENLTGLPQLMRSLDRRRQKFILFIDDLVLDQDDKTYSSLKTILEGSLEKRPSNVVIYATSNRRHLVRQNFSDRGKDEVDAFETIAEKTALAERWPAHSLSHDEPGFLSGSCGLSGRPGGHPDGNGRTPRQSHDLGDPSLRPDTPGGKTVYCQLRRVSPFARNLNRARDQQSRALPFLVYPMVSAGSADLHDPSVGIGQPAPLDPGQHAIQPLSDLPNLVIVDRHLLVLHGQLADG